MKNSIEYLINEVSEILGNTHLNSMQYLLLADALKKAKEMYKQEIIKAFDNGEDFSSDFFDVNNPKILCSVNYYNQNYNQSNYVPSEEYLKIQRDKMEDFVWNRMNKANNEKISDNI